MSAFNRRLVTLAAAAVCVWSLAGYAQARGPFDGVWSVDFSGNSGSCDGLSYQYSVEITNGHIKYAGGDGTISGSVGASGDVSAHVSNANATALGTGKLSGHSGHGKFHGRSQTGVCSGNWSAQRTGG